MRVIYNQAMKKWIIRSVFIVILVFSFGFLIKNQKNKQKVDVLPIKSEEKKDYAQKTLKIGEIMLNIEMADTDATRAQGLSGKDGLAESEGMLFVFENSGYYGIWMKDMNFPIDIAWLDKDKKITYIEKNVGPETYPKVFFASKNNIPILNLYVLETKAGFFENYKIEIGDTVEF